MNLHSLPWTVTGWRANQRHLQMTGWNLVPDVAPVPCPMPGSVQNALLRAEIAPDWHVGLQARQCGWVEQRHWELNTTLPAAALARGERLFLCADGLDYSGWIFVDDYEVGAFRGALLPHTFELPAFLGDGKDHRLSIVFDMPPPEQGTGYTSASRYFKPRYNYGWDWCPRLVPIGVWDSLTIETGRRRAVQLANVCSHLEADNATGSLDVRLQLDSALAPGVPFRAEIELRDGPRILATRRVELVAGENRVVFPNLPVDPWWPNGHGAQKLYALRVAVTAATGESAWERTQAVGFKRVEWRDCEGAPAGADPWICVVNGKPIFLQGVNWTPVQLVYHDTTEVDYAQMVGLYREMGCNLLRVWGGAYLEREAFYRHCAEAGLLVWQEFPLSSSGPENWPPEDAGVIEALREIAVSYVRRRRSHVSLLLWCGGNELQGSLDGGKRGAGKPVDCSHPCIAMLRDVVQTEDPGRRFLPTSSSGPRFTADAKDFGKGLHHDVHGPWGFGGGYNSIDECRQYWQQDDALFRSETGMPGASSLAIIQKYAGLEPVWPPTTPLWMHNCSCWTQWERLAAPLKDVPADEALRRYVEITQGEQATVLSIAAQACKLRFPRCGGFLVWMGHDCYPCLANTSIIDFERNLKPAALALQTVFRETLT